jgi:hypothetical protein
VVGGATTAGDAFHAFVWTHKEGMVDLNKRLRHAPAGLVLYSAGAISDNGAIVANANTGLVLLTPDRGHHGGHTAGPIDCPDLVRMGTPLDASLDFVSEDSAASYKAVWSWGDGSGDQAGDAKAGKAAASHVFTKPGIYTVTASVVDAAGQSATVTRKVIAYDPAQGVVAGAGAFVSPAKRIGNRFVSGGRASFSFVAPSSAPAASAASAAKVARANGQLTFNLGGMSFRSVNLGLTSLQGGSAQFSGSGKFNGAGDYRFTVQTSAGAVSAGQPGRISLKIWHTDPKTGGDIVDYDNGDAAAGRPIVEGSMKVQQ